MEIEARLLKAGDKTHIENHILIVEKIVVSSRIVLVNDEFTVLKNRKVNVWSINNVI